MKKTLDVVYARVADLEAGDIVRFLDGGDSATAGWYRVVRVDGRHGVRDASVTGSRCPTA